MITYEKINELQAEIKYKGKTVGYLEKLIDCYVLELDYKAQVVSSKPGDIKPYLENQLTLNERYIIDEAKNKKRGFTVRH